MAQQSLDEKSKKLLTRASERVFSMYMEVIPMDRDRFVSMYGFLHVNGGYSLIFPGLFLAK